MSALRQKREATSQRTKAALAAAKARGKLLGASGPLRRISGYQTRGVEAARQAAVDAVEERRETMEGLQNENLSLNAMAARLNADSVRTSRGDVACGALTGTADVEQACPFLCPSRTSTTESLAEQLSLILRA